MTMLKLDVSVLGHCLISKLSWPHGLGTTARFLRKGRCVWAFAEQHCRILEWGPSGQTAAVFLWFVQDYILETCTVDSGLLWSVSGHQETKFTVKLTMPFAANMVFEHLFGTVQRKAVIAGRQYVEEEGDL